jgi:hypothetical protein
MRKQKFTVDQVIEALRTNNGFQYLTARKLGCSPETVRTYIQRYPKVKQAQQDASEFVNDLAEGALVKAILAGEPWAVQFRLKTKARDRGYGDKVEATVNGPESGAFPIVVMQPAMLESLMGNPNADSSGKIDYRKGLAQIAPLDSDD